MAQVVAAEEVPPVAALLPPVLGEPPVPFGALPPVPRPCPPVLEVLVALLPPVELDPATDELPATIVVSTELDPPVLVSIPATPATAVVLKVPADPPVS